MRWVAYCTLAAASALGSPAWGQADGAGGEAALVKRAAELRQQPGEGSPSLGALAPQTAVTRLPTRQGAWVQVRTAAGATGWLHIFDLTSASSASGNPAAGALRGLTGLFTRNTGAGAATTTATSTVGIRGLSTEDLARSQPDLAAVAQAEALRQDAGQAQAFASAAALPQRPLMVLPEPQRPASAGAPPAGSSNQGVLP
ncbi:MAG: SH3 domain-containing protein [Burkholderiales bacterium]|nr:SH3 domain-containing protein [Burkholderiales bacterium]